MNTATAPNLPDMVNATATIRMLASTGINPEPRIAELLNELESLSSRDPSEAVAAFLDPGLDDLADRWAVLVAAHLYDGTDPGEVYAGSDEVAVARSGNALATVCTLVPLRGGRCLSGPGGPCLLGGLKQTP